MQRILIQKGLLRKAIHSWDQRFSQGSSKVADYETEVRKWLRQQSNDFEALAKREDKRLSVGGGYDRKYFFFKS
jgi:predicted subunit of tRNA(5-methylaminomethyl-2-thiouridylate) methyltransferase